MLGMNKERPWNDATATPHQGTVIRSSVLQYFSAGINMDRQVCVSTTFGIWRRSLSHPSTVQMKHLSKIIKRKKPSKPSQQPNATEKPTAIAAGPSGLPTKQDADPDGRQILSCCGLMDCPDVTVPPEDRSEIVPQTPFQSGAEDADQEPLIPEARTLDVTICGLGGGNHPTSECS